MINFRKGKYSVPTKYIGEEVQVIFNNSTDELLIYYDGELIRRHNHPKENLIISLKI